MPDPFIELRGDFAREDVDVLDAVAHATPGASRTSLLRVVLAEWAERKRHEATLILRVSRGNGTAAESERSAGGSPAEAQRKGRA